MGTGSFDFGGDATDYKCQARHNEIDCEDKAEFSVLQGPSNTERFVCKDDLADAVDFIIKRSQTTYAYVTALESHASRVGRHAAEGGERT